jgi:YceI-like domain
MGLQVLDGTCVFIALRATGLLRSLAHDPILKARPARVTVDFTAPGAPAPVEASFEASAIEAPAGISASDGEKMLDNLRSREVLDAARFPTIAFRGTFTGTLEGGGPAGGALAGGSLAGELLVKGAARRIAIPVTASQGPDVLVAKGAWEGRLTDLGVKPFKALLGAIKLDDWVSLRVEARFARPAP